MEKLNTLDTLEAILKRVIANERKSFQDGLTPSNIFFPLLLELAAGLIELGDNVTAVALVMEVPLEFINDGLADEMRARPNIFHTAMVSLTEKLLLAGIVDMGQVPDATQAPASA